MFFERIPPGKELENFIECYWIIESGEVTPVKQKIIPDGFPEIIFHYGDPYRININKKWEVQKKALVAGQIKKYFFLENTGTSGVFGIKCKPAGLTHLFGLQMDQLTDKVLPLTSVKAIALQLLGKNIDLTTGHGSMVSAAEKYLKEIVPGIKKYNTVIDNALALIFKNNGAMNVTAICKELFISERHLQRLFKQYVGLSPKLYSRIIRFNYIFQLLNEGKISWLEITYHSGYFDQSHFIRDFKAFTGVDPSKYFFGERNLANFFLKKK
jgi:AraC-like DNA-binding protein